MLWVRKVKGVWAAQGLPLYSALCWLGQLGRSLALALSVFACAVGKLIPQSSRDSDELGCERQSALCLARRTWTGGPLDPSLSSDGSSFKH